jgi:hypothetical protein
MPSPQQFQAELDLAGSRGSAGDGAGGARDSRRRLGDQAGRVEEFSAHQWTEPVDRACGGYQDQRADGAGDTVAGDQHITSIVTADAVRELRLKKGQIAAALIKSTEVMIVLP